MSDSILTRLEKCEARLKTLETEMSATAFAISRAKRTLGEELRDHPATPALLPTLQQPSPELQAMLDKATDEQGLPRVAAFAEPGPPKACTFCGQKFARGANHECSDHVIATRKENDELREKIAELGASQSGLLEALKQIVEQGASASLARRIAWRAVRAVEPGAVVEPERAHAHEHECIISDVEHKGDCICQCGARGLQWKWARTRGSRDHRR